MLNIMSIVFMFGLMGIRKSIPVVVYQIGRRILKFTSISIVSIVKSQHDYFFIPTTEQEFLI